VIRLEEIMAGFLLVIVTIMLIGIVALGIATALGRWDVARVVPIALGGYNAPKPNRNLDCGSRLPGSSPATRGRSPIPAVGHRPAPQSRSRS
jgi:hypothetical protein